MEKTFPLPKSVTVFLPLCAFFHFQVTKAKKKKKKKRLFIASEFIIPLTVPWLFMKKINIFYAQSDFHLVYKF